MIRIVLKIFLFLVGVTLIANALGGIAQRLDPPFGLADKQAEGERNATLLADDLKMITAVAVGNSHSGALDFSALGVNGRQINRMGGDLFETQHYLENYLPKFSTVDTVFINVSYFSFRYDNAASGSQRLNRIYLYVNSPFWRSIPGDFENFLIGKLDPLLPIKDLVRDDSWKGVVFALIAGGGQAANAAGPALDANAPSAPAGECGGLPDDELNVHAEKKALNFVTTSQEMVAALPELEATTYAVLSQMIEYLQARGIRVILHTTPVYQRLTQVYESQAPGEIASMKETVKRLQQQYAVEYYDLSTDGEIVSRPDLFLDSDHLNHCGAPIYSAKLRNLMAADSE